MPRRSGQWVRALDAREKALVEATCARFIEEVLKPRFLLPQIVPSQFSYKVDLGGRWRGKRYIFHARYRSGLPETLGREFHQPYTALLLNERHLRDLRFDLQWMRATGRWHSAELALPLHAALELIETEELFWPP